MESRGIIRAGAREEEINENVYALAGEVVWSDEPLAQAYRACGPEHAGARNFDPKLDPQNRLKLISVLAAAMLMSFSDSTSHATEGPDPSQLR